MRDEKEKINPLRASLRRFVFWRHIATKSILYIFNLFCYSFDIWFIKVVCCGIKAIKSKGAYAYSMKHMYSFI